MDIIMGGLRPYNTEKMIELKSFLIHHWNDVASVSGQMFNYGILDNKELAYDTEPPSRAVLAVRQMDKKKVLDFFFLAQEAFYQDNKNMFLVESYKSIIEKLELDFETFKSLFESDELKKAIKDDFSKAASWGVRSFPTLLLLQGDKKHIIAQGYDTASNMIKTIQQKLKA